ncbi:AAA family ATPase [Acaryochloris marina]|uniref:Ribulose bisphosphate carboxylase activase, putative n=1 Tax=Acaryochloris marina (strain MBIC 11017) TaxID=329726 RepID=B0CCB7_ACAM1|nr:AAA family ATPase [Acaryochloris marina]ABW26802.1 Ribulose bisphosphate carboxylase activase, putative [Acaryochloris marina MBIC11017]
MGYYLSPRFLDRLAVHITKNFMDLPGLRVPLILGIHGRKGEGKSFQCELLFEQMGIEPVRMSAGELESPDAGDPVRLIRMRYREAAELIKVRGKMCVLLINDLDAGAGRMDQTTQYTVNTQLVNGTLMNIADNPTDVQLPGSYDTQPIRRVPILVTGNDFSTLYAPLVRDGRMDKFYWQPNHEDRLGIVQGIFEPDRLSSSVIEQLVNHFADQAIDFFGALRSRIYDEQVRDFIRNLGIGNVSTYLVNSPERQVQIQPPALTLDYLINLGEAMVGEQDRLHHAGLAQAYLSGAKAEPVKPSPPPSEPEANHYLQADIAPQSQGDWPDYIAHHEIEHLFQQAMRQGSQLNLETATQREKAGNVWRSWTWPQAPRTVTDAMAGLQTCLQDHPQSYIKLIGYDPRTQTRTLEELIVRPQ